MLSAELDEPELLNNQASYYKDFKTRMLEFASHDLRSPVAVIFGYLSLLELDKEQFSETHLAYFDHMSQAAQRLQAIVDELTVLRLIEYSAAAPPTGMIEIAPLVQMTYTAFAPIAEEKGIHFVQAVEAEHQLVQGDMEQLQRVIHNLISNAIKFTKAGGRVNLYLYRKEKNSLRFEVSDTGIGVPTAQQAELFQPFFRVKNKQTMDIEGSGLGLYMVKRIIERHGGDIYFHSEPDQGSTFGFTLKTIPE